MKKYAIATVTLIIAFCVGSSFYASSDKGGDVFEIYLNGKQIHQQFVHADKSTKTLQLPGVKNNDKIEVFYSHCGAMGKSRMLTVRNEKNEILKEFRYADADNKRSLMSFYWKEIGAGKSSKLNLYYSAKELSPGKLLASLVWNSKNMARLQ